MTPPKRPGTMSDADRALMRRATPARGIPVEIDPEITPPPQEPPKPSSLDGYLELPHAVREQFDLQAHAIGQVTAAIGKLWDVRKDGERLDRIDSKLGTLAAAATKHETVLEQFLDPAIRSLMGAVSELSQQMPRLSQQLETTSTLLMSVDNRLRTLEGDLRVMSAEFQNARETSAARHAEHSSRIRDLDVRLDTIERKERDREVIGKALAKTERKKNVGTSGVVATVVAAVVAAIAKIIS